MQFEEIKSSDGRVLMLLPGTGCTWQLSFKNVLNELSKHFHLVAVNYDGFDGDSTKSFSSMITVVEKIEDYILENYQGRLDGAYGSSLGGSIVALLIERKRIHINYAFIGCSDFDQGSPFTARLMATIFMPHIKRIFSNEGSREKFKRKLLKKGCSEMQLAFIDEFGRNLECLHPKALAEEFYSDYVTRVGDNIAVNGTAIHVIYALRMGRKYKKRYLRHFRNPIIHQFDMEHEEWLFNEEWAKVIINVLADEII